MRGHDGKAPLRLGEFVPLAAMLTSLVALSIDAMLPALPDIGRDLGAARANDSQLVVSSLMIGLGIGQLLSGSLSDSIGRKPTLFAGLGLFTVGCLVSLYATTFPAMIAGRLLQGIGVAAPRIVTIAMVRDQYEGRAMARIMSFVMAVFILVPMIAPAVGQAIVSIASWRAIFAAFFGYAVVAAAWLALRQPETHPVTRRIPLSVPRLATSAREVLSNRVAMGYTVTTGLVFTPFIGYLSSAQQVFQDVYGVGERFPAYFAALALAIGLSSLVNARLVMRHGMQRLTTRAAGTLAVLSAGFYLASYAAGGVPVLAWFMAYFVAAFFCVGALFGNLNALALEPLGRTAGMGAALVGALSTFISVPLGALIGQAFDGTVLPLVGSFAVFAAAALAMMRWTEKGRNAARPGVSS